MQNLLSVRKVISFFESNQGDLVKAAIDKSISEKSRVNETIEVVAKNDACEVVAKFDMIVSVRVS